MRSFVNVERDGTVFSDSDADYQRGQDAARYGIAAAVLPALEQLPEQFDERLRPTIAERKLRRCDPRLRRPLGESAQDGLIGVQPLFPIVVFRKSMPASYRDHARHQMARIEGGRGVHVQGRD